MMLRLYIAPNKTTRTFLGNPSTPCINPPPPEYVGDRA